MMKQIVRGLLLLAGLVLGNAAQAGKVTYVYTDPQGTPLAEANASGNITATFDYTPYGVPVQGLSGSPNGPGYTGHVNDPDTGFVYMQARYYDPGVGRFLSVDPIAPTVGDTFNFNRSNYAAGNPIVNVDPTGKAPVQPPTGPFSPAPSRQIPQASEIPKNIPGGPWTPAGAGQRPGAFYGPKQPSGPKTQLEYVPSESDGGPPGSTGYWKSTGPSQKSWARYDLNGYPITPEQAHPGNEPPKTAEAPPSEVEPQELPPDVPNLPPEVPTAPPEITPIEIPVL